MKTTWAFLVTALIIMIFALYLAVKALKGLWAHDVWCVGFGFASWVFGKWANNIYEMANAARLLAERQRKEKELMEKRKEEIASIKLSDPFGSFRDNLPR